MKYNTESFIFYRNGVPVPYMALTEAEKQFINEVWNQHWTRLADEANACPF